MQNIIIFFWIYTKCDEDCWKTFELNTLSTWSANFKPIQHHCTFFNFIFSLFLVCMYVTYIIGSFSEDYDLVAYATYAVCVTFTHECRDFQSETQNCEKLFSTILFSLSVFLPEIRWEEVTEEIFFFSNFVAA